MGIIRKTITATGAALGLATAAIAGGNGQVSTRVEEQEGEFSLRGRLQGIYVGDKGVLAGLVDADLNDPERNYGLFNARLKTPIKGFQVGVGDALLNGEHTTGLAIAYTWKGEHINGFVQHIQPFDDTTPLQYGSASANLDTIIAEGCGRLTVFAKAKSGDIVADELVYQNGHLYAIARNLLNEHPNQYGVGVRLPIGGGR